MELLITIPMSEGELAGIAALLLSGWRLVHKEDEANG